MNFEEQFNNIPKPKVEKDGTPVGLDAIKESNFEQPQVNEASDRNKLIADSDQEKIDNIRKSLNIPNQEGQKNTKRWSAIFRPENEWKPKREITTDNPVDKLKRFIKSFSNEAREAARVNKENSEQLKIAREKYSEIEFNYNKGSGVEGWVGNKVGILANGFFECSGLVLQTPEGVSVIHISPNAMRDPSEGGEIVKDQDIFGHIRSGLKALVNKGDCRLRTGEQVELSEKEIENLQKMAEAGELKVTLFAGEDKYIPVVPMNLSSRAKGRNLPFIKTDVHYVGGLVGGGGYSIYASPEDLYVIGSNNTVLKKGVNFPPVMLEYKEID